MDWLLEPADPSVRYFALRDLGGRGVRDRDLERAKAAIMTQGPVPLILAKQKPAGHWGRAEDFYIRTKYWGTVWTFILLAELGADGRDERVRRACEFLLRWSQDRASGGFAYRGSASGGGQPSGVIPCLTGNIVWGLIRFGYLDDPRVGQAVDWIVRYARFDDGDGPAPKGWPYDKREPCYGRHTCFFGVVKPLKALAEIPPAHRSAGVRRTIEQSVEFLLRHRLYKKSHDPASVAKPIWAKSGFPLMWQTDALEMFDILTGLGIRDERMRDAAELIASKGNGQGRWRLERTSPDRTLASLERVGRPSKWITLAALRSLRRYGGREL
ncbi:MAG: nitrogen fixation protein NifH [Candidatus Aminicenantes bacterium]|nr:nitrogen fixation protein NifH [Candidatus Aminicenantes bacterium]